MIQGHEYDVAAPLIMSKDSLCEKQPLGQLVPSDLRGFGVSVVLAPMTIASMRPEGLVAYRLLKKRQW